MASGQGLDVAGIAQKILNAVVSHLCAASGITVPERRIIAPGNIRLIAWDNCEQLIVACNGIGNGAAPTQGNTTQRTGNPISAMGLRHAVYAVQLVRCTPESTDGGHTPPPADVVTTAGLALMRDAGLLSQALVEACSSVAASSPLGRGGSVQPGAVEVIGPEGGMAAVEGSIAITAADLT